MVIAALYRPFLICNSVGKDLAKSADQCDRNRVQVLIELVFIIKCKEVGLLKKSTSDLTQCVRHATTCGALCVVRSDPFNLSFSFAIWRRIVGIQGLPGPYIVEFATGDNTGAGFLFNCRHTDVVR